MKTENDFQLSTDAVRPGVDALVELLARNGFSNTRSRRAVLEVLSEEPGPLNPAEILERGRVRHPGLGLVTVYRTLEILQRLGVLRKLHLEESCHSYLLSTAGLQQDHAHDGHEHGHHVICDSCGRAVEFAGCDVGAIAAGVEAQTGFKVRNHWLEMFGLCPECRDEAGS